MNSKLGECKRKVAGVKRASLMTRRGTQRMLLAPFRLIKITEPIKAYTR
jgi:hypothetical protein